MSKRGPCIARLAQQAGGAEPNKEIQATRTNTDKRYKRAIKYDDAVDEQNPFLHVTIRLPELPRSDSVAAKMRFALMTFNVSVYGNQECLISRDLCLSERLHPLYYIPWTSACLPIILILWLQIPKFED